MKQEKPVTRGYLDKSLEKLARMVKKGFDENTVEHRRIFDRLDKIEMKLSGVVYRQEFDEVKARLKIVEEALALK
jgi:hypothetical protein